MSAYGGSLENLKDLKEAFEGRVQGAARGWELGVGGRGLVLGLKFWGLWLRFWVKMKGLGCRGRVWSAYEGRFKAMGKGNSNSRGARPVY